MIRSFLGMMMAVCCLVFTAVSSSAQVSIGVMDATAIAKAATPESIKLIGYRARITPQVRDDSLHQIARYIKALNEVDRGKLKSMQKTFQEALLLFTDFEVLFRHDMEKELLHRGSIEAVDDALESVFTLEDIRSGYEWNDLAYVYGFFNHDVPVDDIKRVREGWETMPEEERAKQYPTYIHLIDAVVKPLAYWEKDSRREMNTALEEALPLLHDMLFMEPKPGRAFHAPSHAALITAPMYIRWFHEAGYNSRLTRTIGAKTIYGAKLIDLLLGHHPNPEEMKPDEYKFYTVREYYLANALARLNWRYNGKTSERLHKSLEVFQQRGDAERTIHAVERCMAALKDKDIREKWEKDPLQYVDDYVWIIRNGKQEAVTYATNMLASVMGCPVDKAFELYYKQKISDMQRRMAARKSDENDRE